MGRKGYKGIAAVAEDLFVINDDGEHTIRLCEVNYESNECHVMIIAGQPGKEGNLDHDQGTSALLSRPGRSNSSSPSSPPLPPFLISHRIQADLVNMRCYFGSRNFKNIRVLSLERGFPISTLPVSFQTILPAADLDFNRILVTPSGHKMVLADRKGPYIVLVSNVLSTSPTLSLLHTPGCGLKKPLQGACFPIVPLAQHPVWDTPPSLGENPVAYKMTQHVDETTGVVTNDLDRLLPICVDQCLVAAGPRIWLIPTLESEALSSLPTHLLPNEEDLDSLPPCPPALQTTISTKSDRGEEAEVEEDGDDDGKLPYPSEFQPYYNCLDSMPSQCTLLCNVSSEFPKFLIHDMVALTSNTLLVLNRHSRRTGVWQLTTKSSWSFDKKDLREHYTLRYLEGKDYLGPHGMVLSLDRKYLLVVETGLRGESQRRGYIDLMSLHFHEGQVRVGSSRTLIEIPTPIERWEERIHTASEATKQALKTHVGMPYEQLYNLDGDRYEDRGDWGLEFHDHVKPAVKRIGKCKFLSSSPCSTFLILLCQSLVSDRMKSCQLEIRTNE